MIEKRILKRFKYMSNFNYKKALLIAISIFIVGGNLIFLASGFMIKPKDNLVYDEMGMEFTFLNRTFTLLRWDYSKNQDMMEVEFSVENQAFDDKDKYDFYAVTRNGKELEIEKIIEEKSYIVIHLKNVPDVSEVSLMITLHDSEDSTSIKFLSNTEDAVHVDEIKKRNKNEYTVIRGEREIETLNKEISKKQSEIVDNNKKIQNIRETNVELEKEKAFRIESEIEKTDSKIEENKKTIEELKLKNEEISSSISEDRQKIQKMKEYINTLT